MKTALTDQSLKTGQTYTERSSSDKHYSLDSEDDFCSGCRNVKALANEDALLPTQMFPPLPARATFVADTNFVSGTQKMFLILFRNILRPQQMFPSLRSPRNIMGKNVSATMCPRLPGPLVTNNTSFDSELPSPGRSHKLIMCIYKEAIRVSESCLQDVKTNRRTLSSVKLYS